MVPYTYYQTDSNSEEDSISLFFKHYNRNNTEKNNCNNLNMFDYEKINKLREEYIKAKKNNQNQLYIINVNGRILYSVFFFFIASKFEGGYLWVN